MTEEESKDQALGPYSPHLTSLQKASLRTLELTLQNGNGLDEQAVSTFLVGSFQLTREVLDLHLSDWKDLAYGDLLELLEDEPGLLRGLFLDEGEQTSWGQLFWAWAVSGEELEEGTLSLSELNSYLLASVSFYEALEFTEDGQSVRSYRDPTGQCQKIDVPVLDVETKRPPAIEQTEELGEIALNQGITLSEVVEVLSEETLVGANRRETEESIPARPSKPTEDAHTTKADLSSSEDEDEEEELELSSAPVSRFESQNRLVVKKKYLGYGKNRNGVLGLCGQLTLSWFNEKILDGRLESSNPLLFLSKTHLAGDKCVITYWMPPVAFPNPAGHLAVKTSKETKIISLQSLFPTSRTELLRDHQAAFLLLLPSMLACLYFLVVYVLSLSGLDKRIQKLFPEEYQMVLQGFTDVSFRSGGLGLHQLEVIPTAESLQLVWAALIFIAPLVTTKFFRYFAPYRQRRFGGLLALALLLPSLGLLVLWNLQTKLFPLIYHPDFSPLELSNILQWALPTHLVICIYLFLSAYGVWERWIRSSEIRFTLPLVLSVGYGVLVVWLIFGRSWLGS